jgi:type IV pilus assembly protein PilQ
MDVGGYGGDVQSVSSRSEGDDVILEAKRDTHVTSTVERQGNTLLWTFYEPGSLHSSLTGVGRDGLPARQAQTISKESAEISELPQIQTGLDSLIEASTEESDEAGAFGPSVFGQARGFSGRRIDLDLKDADKGDFVASFAKCRG